MDFDAYQKEAKRTAARSDDAYPEPVRKALDATGGYEGTRDRVALRRVMDALIWGQGLAGEAGEVCDLLKKFYGHGKPFDREKLKLELGDVLWYVANLADAHEITLDDVARSNVAKLRARYPSGFTVEAANAPRSGRTACGWSTGEGLCTLPPVRLGRCEFHAQAVDRNEFNAGRAPGVEKFVAHPLPGFDANGSPVDDSSGKP